jgi:3-mercaptopyruvate sulfurtransferase SseA
MNAVAVAFLAWAVPAVAEQKYKRFERGEALITAEELKKLIDARDSKLVVLAVVEPVSYRAGHIPGSINIWRPDYELKVGQPQEYRLEVDGKPAGFKPAAEIQQVIDKFKMDPGKERIFYCQSGVRSTTPVFVLYLMGWDVDRLHNYDGSWLEWSYHEQNPIATGP